MFGDEKIFMSGDAHGDLLQVLPTSCGLLFLDVASLTRLWSRVFFVLDEPLEVSVANQNFNSILQ
ncbi:hypothetical protein A2U01_0075187, partial [Trifolium medium]|nr:hypothetical protein [Trifolium medium]